MGGNAFPFGGFSCGVRWSRFGDSERRLVMRVKFGLVLLLILLGVLFLTSSLKGEGRGVADCRLKPGARGCAW